MIKGMSNPLCDVIYTPHCNIACSPREEMLKHPNERKKIIWEDGGKGGQAMHVPLEINALWYQHGFSQTAWRVMNSLLSIQDLLTGQIPFDSGMIDDYGRQPNNRLILYTALFLRQRYFACQSNLCLHKMYLKLWPGKVWNRLLLLTNDIGLEYNGGNCRLSENHQSWKRLLMVLPSDIQGQEHSPQQLIQGIPGKKVN